MTPLGRRSGLWPAGTAWSPVRGDVGPGAVDVAGNQAGVTPVYAVGVPTVRCVGSGPDTAHWWSGDPPPPRLDSRCPRLVPVRRPGRTGALRGEGQVPPPAPQLLLPGPRGPGPPDRPARPPGRPRGVDGGGLGVRSPPAGAQPDQGAPAPLQRPAEGRQELPVAGPDGQRRVAPTGGGEGSQEKWRALLRSLSQRGGHPRDARPPAAVVPRADLLGHQVPAPPAARPALPPLPHRPLLGTLRGEVDHEEYRASWPT